MIYTPSNAAKMITGEKDQTRLIVKDGDYPIFDYDLKSIFAVHRKARVIYQVGKSYSIQPGRGKPAIGRRVLRAIRQERLQEISEADAKAEGVEPFNSPFVGPLYMPSFASHWDSIPRKAGERWGDKPAVWVLEFEPVQK